MDDFQAFCDRYLDGLVDVPDWQKSLAAAAMEAQRNGRTVIVSRPRGHCLGREIEAALAVMDAVFADG